MNIFHELFSYEDLERILSDESRVQSMLDFEAALARAEARTGVIPAVDAPKIAAKCNAELFDLAAIRKETALAGNVAIPLIKSLTDLVAQEDKDAARFVHWGATSQDVIDTASVLQLRRAFELIDRDLTALTSALCALAERYRETPVVARTWMQHALPTTFGYIVAGWLDAVLRHRHRLTEIRARALSLQFGGAVGTLAALAGHGPEVAKALAEELQLCLPAAPWHSHRDRVAEVATTFGLLTGTLGKIARDISLHSQTEIQELFEPAGQGRGGSSTLPHKRNPVTCAVVLAAANRVPGLVSNILTGMVQEQERGLGSWHAEWETLPEIVRLSAGALHHLASMLPALEVHPERMRRNLDGTHGLIFAEAVSSALAGRMGKMPAHRLVEAACQKAREQDRPLLDILREEPGLRGHLAPADLTSLFEVRNYLGSAAEFVQRVLAATREFSAAR